MFTRIPVLLVMLLMFAASLSAAEYNPLEIKNNFKAETMDLTVQDSERKREIPIKIYLPADRTPQAVAMFSHGLGGSREGSAFLGQHWAARGYVAVFLQHPGSDESVWKDVPLLKRMFAMKQAASAQNFQLRVKDVPAVINQLAKWNSEDKHRLKGRLNLQRVGMSGHSFGAQTTQAVSGQSVPFLGARFTDTRIKSAIIMSPGAPKRGDKSAAFAQVKIPWLLMTGTNDTSPIGGQTVESRLAVFPELPAGSKYQLVLHNAEHSVFTERALPGDRQPRNPNHHKAILAISTAFWDATLNQNPQAKAWLQGESVRKVLEADDRWQKK